MTHSLILDELMPDPTVARRLSPAVAFRYHALPVAEDGGYITVAMADPNDSVAREAVEAALAARPWVVQGDAGSIDQLLSQLWPDPAENDGKVLVCAQPWPGGSELLAYAQYVGPLIHAEVSRWSRPSDVDALAAETALKCYDLVILGAQDQSFVERLISGPAERKAADRISGSLLIARKPRWPIQRILLLLAQDEPSDAAVDWVVRLAQSADATVTILAVVPPVPAMYHGLSRMQQDLSTLLEANTELGRQMRHVARRLVDENVDAKLRLRQGRVDWEVQHEIIEADYELVVMTGDGRRRLGSRLSGGLVGSLLSKIDRPFLIATPAYSAQ